VTTRLETAAPTIIETLNRCSSPVLRQGDLRQILAGNRAKWKLAQKTSLHAFTEFLLSTGKLQRVSLQLPHRPETLYVWGDVSAYFIATSVKPGSYLCHSTAMQLHGLADRPQTTIYANHEQRPIPPPEEPLTQQGIDAAFRRPQRLTTNVAPLGEHRLCLVNGKHTGRLGVLTIADEHGRPISVTGLERTLIDIAVRPAYSGGPSAVLAAFRRARGRLSSDALAATLAQMAFVYPYHQAVGFYLERAGVSDPSELARFRTSPLSHDFYLAHGMKKTAYSARWRLYHPADF
jgi:hypothetical protein